MNSRTSAYRVLVLLTVFGLIWSTGACSDNNSPPADSAAYMQALSPNPNLAANQVTPGGQPTATPTEIPLILPTPTEVGAGTPIPTSDLLPPPTATPIPTATTAVPPTATAGPPLATQPPGATAAPVQPTAPRPTNTPIPPPTPTPTLLVNVAGEVSQYLVDYGFRDDSLGLNYPLTNQCIRGVLLGGSGTETKTQQPYTNEQNVIARANDDAWFYAAVELYIRPPTGTNVLKSRVIEDALSYQLRKVEFRPDLVLFWHVMNNLTIQLIDPATDPVVYQNAYEESLNRYVSRMISETRARIIIGNVPDITNLWYFKPCYSAAHLRGVQTTYNNIIASVAARYPGRVFVADLTRVDLGRFSAQYVSLSEGFTFTIAGHREIARVFGDIINRLGITQPPKTPSLYYPPTPGPTRAGGGSSGGGGGSGSTTATAPAGSPGQTTTGGGTTGAPGTTAPATTAAPGGTPTGGATTGTGGSKFGS